MAFALFGQHRSGTSCVLDLIRHHPSVDTINEPFSMHLDFFRENETRWSANEYDVRCLHGELAGLDETIEYIRDLDRWMNFPFPNVRGFKETALFEKYGWLKKAVRFDQTLVLLRDPRAFIASVVKRRLHESWWNYRERAERYYKRNVVEPSWLDNPALLCAVIWKSRMEYLIEIIDQPNSVVLRLEDIMDDTETVLPLVMASLGLQVSDTQLEFLEETSRETRGSTYSNYRTKEDVLYGWEKHIGRGDLILVEDYLSDFLLRFGYRR